MNGLNFLPGFLHGVPGGLAGFLPLLGKHRRDPLEKAATLARRRAKNRVARGSRRLNRRLQRERA